MKLDTPSIPVKTGGVTDQGEFSIKNSAAAFSILSSGLYSNKYEAILRELGCNAYDSHVEAGFPEKPFTVHLPTRLNPIFSVRDYGVGLDHESVMGLYTTYFASTKNDSNDFVGCMGLGSKSPFSYTKNFTITAIKDGVKGQYSAYIGEQGVPNIVQLATEETDEGNGVEVAFAVEDRNDMRQFQHEAKNVYKWFQTRPEFTGSAIDIPELKYAEMDIIPGTHMAEHRNWGNKSYAIMGNVAYPINVPSGEDLPEGVRSLLHDNSFMIRFEIGELAIAASREELGYDPQTIKSLISKGQELLAAMEIYVVNKIKPAKTKWERNLLAAELIKSNENLFGSIVHNYLKKNKAKFVKGTKKQYSHLEIIIPIAELDKAVDGMKYTFKSIRKNYSSRNKTHLGNIKPLRQNKPKRLWAKADGHTGYNPSNKWDVFGIDATNTIIIFNDEKGNVLQRIRQAFADVEYKELFGRHGQLFIVQAQNKKSDKKAILKYVKTRFGNAPILLASQLPPLMLSSGSTGNESVTVQRFAEKPTGRRSAAEYTFHTIYSKMKDIEPTVEKGKKKTFLYLKLSHKSIMQPKGSDTWTATRMYDYLVSSNIQKIAGINLKNIYGVNKTSLKTVTKDARWVDFFDYIQQEFDKIDWNDARTETEHKIIGQQFSDSDYSPMKVQNNSLAELAKTDTPIGKMFAKWNEWKNNIPKRRAKGKGNDIEYDRLIIVMQKFFPGKDFTKTSAKLDVTKIEKEYDKLFNDVIRTYPMLRHLSLGDSYGASGDWRDAIAYIKLVDSAQ